MVYRDPWLPGDNPYVTSPVRVGIEELSVNCLLCAGGKKGVVAVVNAIFNPLEAELILNIPLSRRSIPDGWMWKWEKRGHYSVKSGYKELSRDKDTMCRGMYHQSSVWNSIW